MLLRIGAPVCGWARRYRDDALYARVGHWAGRCRRM